MQFIGQWTEFISCHLRVRRTHTRWMDSNVAQFSAQLPIYILIYNGIEHPPAAPMFHGHTMHNEKWRPNCAANEHYKRVSVPMHHLCRWIKTNLIHFAIRWMMNTERRRKHLIIWPIRSHGRAAGHLHEFRVIRHSSFDGRARIFGAPRTPQWRNGAPNRFKDTKIFFHYNFLWSLIAVSCHCRRSK